MLRLITTPVLLLIAAAPHAAAAAAAAAAAVAATSSRHTYSLDGHRFPSDFIYGCGTSAYQIEGAWNEDGKGVSIWDKFAHDKGKQHIKNDETGDVAMDFYHTYARDIPHFAESLGTNNYDFTLAWTRILPNGGTKAKPNQKGIDFYRRVAHATHRAGLSTSCTLYHWDLPQALQDAYGGWLSEKVVDDFRHYARVTIDALGDVCDRWISMNEPRTFCTEGFGPETDSAPGVKGPIEDRYRCMHHTLLAHAAAHDVFKDLKKKGRARGTFGIKIDGQPAKPLHKNKEADKEAALRHMEFEIGWDLAPLTTGDYPALMRRVMGDALPRFTPAQSTSLRDSYDIIWWDVYTSTYAGALEGTCDRTSEAWPVCVEETNDGPDGKPIGKPTGSSWNFLVDDTIYQGMRYMRDRWGAKALAIGENGMGLYQRERLSLQQQLNDKDRIEWYNSTLHNVKRLLDEEPAFPLKAFVPWSCMSNLEWSGGYEIDFGLIYTTPGKNQRRIPKASARYLKEVLTGRRRSTDVNVVR